MTQDITIHGFPVSPHVRAARIAFAEKHLPVAFNPIAFDHLASDEYRALNPFGKMPTLTHGMVALYETPALMVYANALGSGPALEPADALARARMFQFIGVAQSYLYPTGVMKLYFHRVLAGLFGMEPDTEAGDAAVGPVTKQLDVLDSALATGHLAGSAFSLADIYCGVMVDYVARTRDGKTMLATRPRLAAWLNELRSRDSFQSTFAPMLANTDQS